MKKTEDLIFSISNIINRVRSLTDLFLSETSVFLCVSGWMTRRRPFFTLSKNIWPRLKIILVERETAKSQIKGVRSKKIQMNFEPSE